MPFQQLSDPQVNCQHNLTHKNKIKSRIGRLHKRSSNPPMFIFQAENLPNFLKQLGSFSLMSSRKDAVSSHWTYIYAKSRSESTWESFFVSRSRVGDYLVFVLPGTLLVTRHLKMLSYLSGMSPPSSPCTYP